MRHVWEMRDEMRRFLFVVSKEKPELCEYLSSHFADEADVLVTLDRRSGERRRRKGPAPLDRRQSHRRWRPDNDETLSALGAFMVPVDQADRLIRE